MARNRTRADAVPLVSRRYIIAAQPPWVEPVLQPRDGPVVLKRPSIPDAAKRRHFVVSRAPTRPHRQDGIRPHDGVLDRIQLAVLFGHVEALCRRELVTGIEWRRMAACASLPH